MNKNSLFFGQLIILSLIIASFGYVTLRFQWFSLPSIFFPLIVFYFLISSMAFLVNLKGTKKESEIAVWYYMASIMTKFLLAATAVLILTKLYPEEKSLIVFTNFALYPLYEAVVILDIYKRIRS